MQDPAEEDLDDDTDTLLPPGEVRTGADVEAGEEARAEGLKPADIDAYWLQRNVNKAYSNSLDENEAVKKAEEVFNALQVTVLLLSLCLVTTPMFAYGKHFVKLSGVLCVRLLDIVHQGYSSVSKQPYAQ